MAEGNPDDLWSEEYDFTTEYGLDNVTAESLEELTEAVRSNSSVFATYYGFNSVKYDTDAQACEDDGACKTYHMCAMSELDYDSFEDCVTSDGSYFNLPGTFMVPLSIASLALHHLRTSFVP